MAALEMSDYYRTVLNAMPVPVFVVDEDMSIVDFNVAAGPLAGAQTDLRKRGGDLLHCMHAFETPGGCGRSLACRDCVMRSAVIQALAGYSLVQRDTRMEFLTEGSNREAQLRVTATPFEHLGRRLALLILEDVTELMRLRELVPLCTKCRRARDDRAYWQRVDQYFDQHVDVNCHQGLCPKCQRKGLVEEPARPAVETGSRA